MARLRRSCNARNARCRRQKEIPVFHSVVVSSAYVLLSGGNSAATPPGVEVAFLAPGKISSRHVAKVLGLVAKKSDVQAEGTLLVLRDKTMSSKYTLVLALVALVAEDPEKLPALKELVLRSATEGQLPVEQWPQELQALVGPPDAEIHPELLAEAYVIARHGDGPDWDFMASLLGAYRLRQGHSEVPPNHREVGLELGDWLAGQRVRAAEGQLGPERFQRLQETSEFASPSRIWSGSDATVSSWLSGTSKETRGRGRAQPLDQGPALQKPPKEAKPSPEAAAGAVGHRHARRASGEPRGALGREAGGAEALHGAGRPCRCAQQAHGGRHQAGRLDRLSALQI
ncbi:unnamed protein product [Effrenium voratum]|nr:unnamed protein product [Effrenium voratum]